MFSDLEEILDQADLSILKFIQKVGNISLSQGPDLQLFCQLKNSNGMTTCYYWQAVVHFL